MATWLEKWISICPDGIVTDQVINNVFALQIEQGKEIAAKTEPIPVVDPGPTGEPGTGGTSAGEEGDGEPVPPGV